MMKGMDVQERRIQVSQGAGKASLNQQERKEEMSYSRNEVFHGVSCKVLPKFLYSTFKFGEHLYVCFFVFFIRQTIYLSFFRIPYSTPRRFYLFLHLRGIFLCVCFFILFDFLYLFL